MYKYTQDFWNKYHDNQEMLAIGNSCAYYLAGAYVSDEDFCIICEAMYGYKLGIADKYGFSMESAMTNLKYLNGIFHGEEYFGEGQESWMGYFSNQFGTNKPAYICVKDFASEDTDKYKETLIHEIYHLISTNYIEHNNMIYSSSYGLENSPYIDEVLNQRATITTMQILGIDIPQSSLIYTSNYLSVPNMEINQSANGYSNIVNFSEQIEQAIGPEIYRLKFEGDGTYKMSTITTASKLNGYIQRFFETNNIDDYINAQKTMVDSLIFKLGKDYSTTEYLKDIGELRKLSGSLYLETSSGTEKVNIIDMVSQSREIELFYCNLKSTSPSVQLDITTRDKECADYILALAALKQNVETYTDTSFSTFNYSKMKDGTVVVTYQGETYYAKGKQLENGFIQCESTGPISEYKKPNLQEQIKALFKRDEEQPSITDAQKIDMAHFTDAVDVKIKYNFATLWDIASSKRSFSFNEINSAIDNTDISQSIQYGNNKLNICHLLAVNDNFCSFMSIQGIAERDIDSLRILLQEQDSTGRTPLDYIPDLSNSLMISSLTTIAEKTNNPAIVGIVNDAIESRQPEVVSENTNETTLSMEHTIQLDIE